MKTALAIAVLSLAFGLVAGHEAAAQAPVAELTDDEAGVAEAVLRTAFQNSELARSGKFDYFFIAFGSASSLKDPGPEFLKRFEGNSPAVKPASAGKRGPGGAMVDRTTGKPGMLFRIERISWTSEDIAEVKSVAVAAGYSVSPAYKVVREGSRWEVSFSDSDSTPRYVSQQEARRQGYRPPPDFGGSPLQMGKRPSQGNAPPVVSKAPVKPNPPKPARKPARLPPPLSTDCPQGPPSISKGVTSQDPPRKESEPPSGLPPRRSTSSGESSEDTSTDVVPTQAEDEAAIVEAVFRYEFQNSAPARVAQAEFYFLGFGAPSGLKDPGFDFLERFAGDSPPVKAASASKRALNGVVTDKTTSRPGAIFRVERIRWLDRDNAIVLGGCIASSRSSSTEVFGVVRQNSLWTVSSATIETPSYAR